MEILFLCHHRSNMSNYQIKIDEPCHENWDAMSPKEQGRFCGVCAKDVVDFTSMSDQEVKSYFVNYKGSICGRFNSNQLHQKDARYFSLTDYTKRFIKAFATVFLIVSAASCDAQTMGKPMIKGDVVCTTNYEITHKGTIYGTDGMGIKNVALYFYQDGVLKKSAKTANNGSYTLTLKNGSYELIIHKNGFQKILTDIQVSASGTIVDFELIQSEEEEIDRPIMGQIQMMGAPRMVHPVKKD